MKTIWKSTVGSIITALVMYTLAGLAGSIIDAVSNVGTDIMSYIWDLAMALEGDMDFFEPDAYDVGGIIANVLVVIGCFMLLSSLSQFKELQKSEDTELNVGKVRSGYVILILAVLIDFIPLVGSIFAFILYIIGNAKQISGYKNLCKSESLPESTRQGFDTLRLCVVWILIGDIIGIIPFIGDIVESIISFFVFFGMINGWRTVRDHEPDSTLVSPSNTSKEALNNVRLYDAAKLAEIAGSEGIYNSELVLQCRHELEIRNNSEALYEKIKELDDNRINEIIGNSIAYSEEFVYGCEREKALRIETRKQEEIQKKEANKKWWKKWWWAVALVFVVAEVVQYKVSEWTEKPSEEYGSANTPTIADFADEVVRWISVVDVDDNFRDLEKEHSLDVQLEPYNEIILKDISYGSYDLKLTASFGEFQKSRKAVPYQYDIFISFPYSRNLIEKYKQLYDELAKRLEYGESVEFRYNDTDIETMFDGNGFRITLGKDLYLQSQDDWSQW